MIAIDAKQLQGTISLLIAQSGELAGAADSIVSASCKAGLPGYASQAGQAAEELSKMALALASVANVLSVRRSLAIAAMTNPGLNARLYVAELADPDGFYNKLRDIAVGMARDASFTSNAVGGASRTMEALSALLRSGPLLQPSPVELSQMRNALSKGSAAYWKAMGHSPWWGKTMLSALELQAGTSALAARLALVGRGGANLLEAVEKAGKGAGGIALAGLLSGGFQALDDWRSGVRDHRLERLAVSGGVSMGAALVGRGICVVGGIATAGLACFGLVVVAGAAGGVMASEINEDYFTSHRDEIARCPRTKWRTFEQFLTPDVQSNGSSNTGNRPSSIWSIRCAQRE